MHATDLCVRMEPVLLVGLDSPPLLHRERTTWKRHRPEKRPLKPARPGSPFRSCRSSSKYTCTVCLNLCFSAHCLRPSVGISWNHKPSSLKHIPPFPIHHPSHLFRQVLLFPWQIRKRKHQYHISIIYPWMICLWANVYLITRPNWVHLLQTFYQPAGAGIQLCNCLLRLLIQTQSYRRT